MRKSTLLLVPLIVAATACADSPSAPRADAVPVVQPVIKPALGQPSRIDPSGDDVYLVHWSTASCDMVDQVDIHNLRWELRLVGLRADGSSFAGHSDYFGDGTTISSYPGGPGSIIELYGRPHENTRESVNSEVYCTDGFGVLNRIGTRQFFWKDNSDTATFCNGQSSCANWSLGWSPTSYAVASRTIEPAPVDLVAGQSLSLTVKEFAANGVEIFNGPAVGWTIGNTSLASVNSPTSAVVNSEFGADWRRQSNVITGQLAGTTTVTAAATTVGVTVRPSAVISGPTSLPTTGSSTYTATVGGCNTTCSIAWYVDGNYADNTPFHIYKGTGTSKSITGLPEWGAYVDIEVDVTSNGVTNIVSKHVRNYARGTCDTRTC